MGTHLANKLVSLFGAFPHNFASIIKRVRNTHRCSWTIWCIWLGLLLGKPYVLGFSEPFGTVSFASTYGFVGLGILFGLWLCSFDSLLLRLQNKTVRYGLWSAGMLFTIPFFCLDAVRLGSLTSTWKSLQGAIANVSAPDPLSALFTVRWLLDGTTALAPYEGLYAFGLVAICILCGHTLRFPKKQSCKHDRSNTFAAMGLILGMTRVYAWSSLLPHPSYPLPMPDMNLTASDQWSAGFLSTVFLPALIASVVILAIVYTKGFNNVWSLIGGAGLGEIVIRAAIRLWPGLLLIPHWVAILCCVFQLLALVAAFLCGQRGQRIPCEKGRSGNGGSEARTNPPRTPSLELTPDDTELLRARGITTSELEVIQAELLGLTSSEAADKLGIKPSTVRAYRARVCSKLGLTSIKQLSSDFTLRRGVFQAAGSSPANQPMAQKMRTAVGPADQSNSRIQTISVLLARIGTLGCTTLVLLPCGPSASQWDMTWVMAFGCAAGLALGAIWQSSYGCRGHWSNDSRNLKNWLPLQHWAVAAFALSLIPFALIHLDSTHANVMASSPWGRLLVVLADIGVLLGAHSLLADTHKVPYTLSIPNGIAVASSVFLLAGLACWEETLWMLILSLCFAATVLGRCLSPQGGADSPSAGSGTLRCGANQNTRKTTTAGRFLDTLIAGSLGCVGELVWRGQTYVSLQEAFVPFLMVVLATLLFREFQLMRLSAQTVLWRNSLPWVLASVGGFVALWYHLGLPVALLLACCLALPHKAVHPAAVAMGLCAGVYGINLFGTQLMRMEQTTVEGSVVFFSAASWTIGLLFLSLALSYAISSCYHAENERLTNLARNIGEQALRDFLSSKGLNPLQVEIVASLVEGKTADSIAHSLYCSSSTVHRAYRQACERLGTHGKNQLLAYMVQELG